MLSNEGPFREVPKCCASPAGGRVRPTVVLLLERCSKRLPKFPKGIASQCPTAMTFLSMLLVVFCSRLCICNSPKLLFLRCQYLYATDVHSAAVCTARAIIELPREVAEISSSPISNDDNAVPATASSHVIGKRFPHC